MRDGFKKIYHQEIVMYALAISGSPRKGGNTELLLKEVLTELKDAG
jgi:hypothetical protein